MARTTRTNPRRDLTDAISLTNCDSITVLHVEDDPDFRELTSNLLERVTDDITVCTEPSAEAALDRLDREPGQTVDCIVSDYDMPGMDGIEFLEAVRTDSPDLPFVLFTGKGSESIASEAISAGVTEYLQKGMGTDQFTVLANRIENAVQKHRAERTIEQTFSALDTAREGISLLDADGQFVYVNESYADIYGYDSATLLGEHWELLYPEASADRVTDEILPRVREGGTWTGETTHVRSDGTEIAVDHALAYTNDGLLICTVREPTGDDPRDAPSPATLDALDDLLFVFDEDGTLQYWNEAVAEVTGHSETELERITPTEFVRPEDRRQMAEYVREAERTGEARAEAKLLTNDGETIPYEFISKRVTDDGEQLGRIGLGRDISERKRYERQVEEQNDRLEHFAEVLSHDLRNPLSVARTRLELLAETGEDDHYVTARDALDRMDEMIDDVLTLARSTGSIDADEYKSVELRMVATNAWALIDREGATLDVAGSTTLDVDASRLQQVLENLFRNAIEHCGDDVTVRVGMLPGESGFYVEDDGPGIPADEREEVFDAGHSTKDGGTGFGLTSVGQIADAHGWDVTVAESDAGGARFEFTGVETGE